MGLSKELSCEAESFCHCCNSHRCFQSEVLKLYFPALEPWVVQFVSLPSCSYQFICTRMWDCQPLPCHVSFLPWLSFSTPPTSLDDCFFFNSLVVRLPYTSIFWQFWLGFFVFKFVVLLLLLQRGKVYLFTPPSWLEVLFSVIL